LIAFSLTDAGKGRTVMPMIRLSFLLFLVASFASCASKPPVQLMAEAREAVQSVQAIYVDDEAKSKNSYKYYQSAEQALLAASQALDNKNYDLARQKAYEAKRQARMAAKLK